MFVIFGEEVCQPLTSGPDKATHTAGREMKGRGRERRV